jgi:hypothetical protein
VCNKENQGLTLDQSFCNAQSNGKSISTTCTSAKFIDNYKTVFVDISVEGSVNVKIGTAQDETYLRMKAVSLISDAKVETLASMLSSIETRAKS